jgi:hypothetical protein
MGQAAWAEDGEEPGWVPSINLGFDTFTYDTRASVENHLNPPAHGGIQSYSSTELKLQSGAELMSPGLALPGRPRLFVQGGAQLGTFSSNDIFRTGDLDVDPEDPEFDIKFFQTLRSRDLSRGCDKVAPPTCITAEEGEFKGQGARIDAEIQSPSWYAAVGVAFDIPVSDSVLLQVKPSAAYNVEKVDLTGKMTTVFEINPIKEKFVVHRGAASESRTDHSLGFGLELGLFLFRSVRPITTSLYVDARFLWLLGDPTTTFSTPPTELDPDPLATFSVEREQFMIRGGAGLRFSWLGFGGR